MNGLSKVNSSTKTSFRRFKKAAYFLLEGEKSLHYKELTAQAIRRKLLTAVGKNPAGTMYAVLSRDIVRNGKKSLFVRPKPAHFALNRKYLTRQNRFHSPDNISPRYLGKAAEHRVLFELLIRGYNPSYYAVDDGIDIRASKGSKDFKIQVKWRNGNRKHFNIKKHYLFGSNRINYFVFILNTERLWIIVMPFEEVRRRINRLGIKLWKHKIYPVSLIAKEEKIFFGNTKSQANDVTQFLENWILR
jgi:hypothetical protein